MPSLKVNEPSAYRPAPWHFNTQADRVGVRSSAAWGVRVARGCGLAIVYVLLVAGRALGAAQEC